MVTLPPGRLPATAVEAVAVDAVVAFEKSSPPAAARQTYALAVRRWPDNLAMELGLGNTAYAAGDRAAAAEAFQRASELHPDSGAAFNNLAVALLELGQLQDARAAAEKALALGGPWRKAALDTLASIEIAEKSRRP
jgi:Flp pilus assembly protein TadD